MHAAERELTIALPLVIAAAKSPDLKILLQIHLKETQGHLEALDDIATHLNQKLPVRTCGPITALIAKAVTVIGKRVVSSDQDAALIHVGRQIEQFEMKSYRELCDTAKDHGMTHEVALLTSILDQERLADELLGELAAGKGPIKELIEEASLKRVWAH
jgi:ferritin-like metal-binding protein YciE